MNKFTLWAIITMMALAGLETGSPGVTADTVKAAAIVWYNVDLPKRIAVEQDRIRAECLP